MVEEESPSASIGSVGSPSAVCQSSDSAKKAKKMKKSKRKSTKDSTKVLKVEAREFRSIVQRMTGMQQGQFKQNQDWKPQLLKPQPQRPIPQIRPSFSPDIFRSDSCSANDLSGPFDFQNELQPQNVLDCFTELESFLGIRSPKWVGKLACFD